MIAVLCPQSFFQFGQHQNLLRVFKLWPDNKILSSFQADQPFVVSLWRFRIYLLSQLGWVDLMQLGGRTLTREHSTSQQCPTPPTITSSHHHGLLAMHFLTHLDGFRHWSYTFGLNPHQGTSDLTAVSNTHNHYFKTSSWSAGGSTPAHVLSYFT